MPRPAPDPREGFIAATRQRGRGAGSLAAETVKANGDMKPFTDGGEYQQLPKLGHVAAWRLESEFPNHPTGILVFGVEIPPCANDLSRQG